MRVPLKSYHIKLVLSFLLLLLVTWEGSAQEHKRLYVKTNGVGLGLLIANAAVEMEVGNGMSVVLPVYFSGWDYFSHDLKFRTLGVQPELRYWLGGGLFVGSHVTVAYYNLAWKRDYRIQDMDRGSPALGAGVSLGYRMPISDNSKWMVELACGWGGYYLRYNKFHNTHNGYMVDEVKRVYWGVDQLAVSLVYRFDLKRWMR